jgi:D-lactate dehydrogenase
MTRIVLTDSHRFEREQFEAVRLRRQLPWDIQYLDVRLTAATADLARGATVLCPFVNDQLDAPALSALQERGVRLLALRSAGFNHVDLAAAKAVGIPVVRVPAYSPHAVAEHAVALLLTLVRKTHRAWNRVRESNFSLDGLVGFDLAGKTVGVIGTGRIGRIFARILAGFGCRVLGHDKLPDPAFAATIGLDYVSLDALLRESDVISLHTPLTGETRHLIDGAALARTRPGVIIINTGRGALLDSRALIAALKSGHLGGAGLDVYEEEENVFFHDLSDVGVQDDLLARLMTFPNVLITSHQGFLTREALAAIAEVTLDNIEAFLARGELRNLVE